MEDMKLFRLNNDFWLAFGSVIIGLIAVFWDLKYRKIPNWLTYPAIVFGIILNLAFNSKPWYFSLAGLLAGFLILLIPYMFGGIGAGDVKLLMALGAFLGAGSVVWIGLYGGIAGGALSLFVLVKQYGFINAKYRLYLLLTSIWNKENRQILQSQPQTSKLDIPYGVAIFIGLIISLAGRPFIWG
jgi:prepilin peptidase CpaA